MISRLRLLSIEAEAKEKEVKLKEEEVLIIQKKDPHKNTQDSHNNVKIHIMKEEEAENGKTNP
jgi:hypothetical protein